MLAYNEESDMEMKAIKLAARAWVFAVENERPLLALVALVLGLALVGQMEGPQ